MIKALDIIEEYSYFFERVNEPITYSELETLWLHVIGDKFPGDPRKEIIKSLHSLKSKIPNSTYTGTVYRGLKIDFYTLINILKTNKIYTDDLRSEGPFESWAIKLRSTREFMGTLGIVLKRNINPRNQVLHFNPVFFKNLKKASKNITNDKYMLPTVRQMLDEIKPFLYQKEVILSTDRNRKYTLCDDVVVLFTKSLLRAMGDDMILLKSVKNKVTKKVWEQLLSDLSERRIDEIYSFKCNKSGLLSFVKFDY